MTNDETTQFYKDLGALCVRYGIAGVAGVWFHGTSDHYGSLVFHAPNNQQMKDITEGIQEMYLTWVRGIYEKAHSEIVANVREVAGPDDTMN
jgi:hypothetical protein